MTAQRKAVRLTRISLSAVVLVAVLLTMPSVRAVADSDWLQKGVHKNVKVYDGRVKLAKTGDEIDRRGKVTIRRLISKCPSDWGNDPTALPYLFYQLSMR
ncbi:MAG: hypothetical protein WCS01_07170, partial [bacterium]